MINSLVYLRKPYQWLIIGYALLDLFVHVSLLIGEDCYV